MSIDVETNRPVVAYEDILQAAERVEPYIVKTPVLESEALNEAAGCRLLFKVEALQKTGAFKIRGATNFLLQLPDEQRKNGVIAYSSGNHAQGVAAAAKMFGIPAVIVMPNDAPEIKVEGTRRYGAEVVRYDRKIEAREAVAGEIARARNLTLVPPFDHPWTMAGQGTVGLEFFHQTAAMGIPLDKVFVPCSGGGLVTGIANALNHLSPETEIFAVEPEGYDDTRRSLRQGKRVRIQPEADTICDSLTVYCCGELTFPVMRRLVKDAVTVSDSSALKAMGLLFKHLKIVAEPGGAAGLAAVLKNRQNFQNQTIGVVISGGNVDPTPYIEALKAL